MRRVTIVLGVSLLTAIPAAPRAFRQTPAPPQTSAGYVFPAGAGMLFFHVRPEKTADFDAVASRINASLEQAQDPVRRQQSAGWRIYKSAEAAAEAVVYIFVFDPAVAGADYDPVKLLGEAAPAESQALYERLKSSVLRVERMALTRMR